jgi:hypothetical protein
MGSLSNESFDVFLDSLKNAGIEITNEQELRERLAEAQWWRYAFTTLASNGRSIGICFKDRNTESKKSDIHRAFSEFQFPENAAAIFDASLKTHH